ASALFGTPLTAADADRYVAEMTIAAELLGVPHEMVPDSVATLDRYFDGVRADLRRTPAAAESMGYLLDPPGLDEDIAGLWQDIRDAAVIGVVSVAALTLLRGRRNGLPGTRRLRLERGLAAVGLAARGGARYATSAPRLFASAGEHRQALRNDLALQTAEDVTATLGTMKGVLMKLGQMASYVDDGLSPAARRTLSRLQDSVPPMSPELAAQVITEELGQPPDQAFATWDPEPIAAA